PDGNRHAVLVTSADKEDVSFTHPLIADINIGRNIAACQMTDMNGAICIGKRSSNQDAVVFFHNYGRIGFRKDCKNTLNTLKALRPPKLLENLAKLKAQSFEFRFIL